MEGGRGRYHYYFLHFLGLGSKCNNVKPSYLIELPSEIGAFFHILVHHGPNTGKIVLKFASYIVYNICKRMEENQTPLSRLLFALWGTFGDKRGNINPSYLIDIQSEIGTLFHILIHHGPNKKCDRSEICCTHNS